MDAYQQHHRYMRPPPQPPPVPPSTTDPHHYHHQSRPPVPPQGTWYSNQFQYHPPTPPPSSSHSPSAPPPQHWVGPSPAYPQPPPPLNPYSTHLTPQNHQFPPPPPRPHVPLPPYPLPQSYTQEWGNPNWGQHQVWDYSSHNNAEDWAAKARAWAASKKVAMEDQHLQSQFTSIAKPEEQSRYYDQYPEAVDSHYQDIQQQQPFPASGYQQFPSSTVSSQHPPIAYPQESASFNFGQSAYVPDGNLPYSVGGGPSTAAPTASPSVHQQEVPSSYSSVAGKEGTAEQEQLYNSLPLPMSAAKDGQHHLQPSLPAIGRPVLTEQPFAYGNQPADPTTDHSDQPFDFAPSFSHDHDTHMQSGYAGHHDSAGTLRGIASSTPTPSTNSWTPAVTTGAVYPPIPPALPSGPQHDPSIILPSSVSGNAAPPYGSFPGSSFQPTVPPAGAAYGLGAGAAFPPTAGGFPGDAYGVSNVSERPKKASVPNWLKEEIIKNASVITRSSLEHPKEETQSVEDEGADKSFLKGDQADSKSIDSSRSTDEEDDVEDYAETARTAAINQEIKRVLTEVLLKVTDELFDEIATKVLNEDDLTLEVEHNTTIANQKVSPYSPPVSTPKASAKVLVPVKAKESEAEDVNENSSSSSPGNVLGLANYASDEDDDEVQSSTVSNSSKNAMHQQSSILKFSNEMHNAAQNGVSLAELGKSKTDLASDLCKTSSIESNNNLNDAIRESSEHTYSYKVVSGARDGVNSVDVGKTLESNNGSVSTAGLGEDVIMKSESLGENVNMKKSKTDDSQAKETRMRSDKDNQHESKLSYSGKDFVKEAEWGSREDEKGGDHCRREDEKTLRKDKTDDRNGSKDRKTERGNKMGDKARESELRKRSSHLDVKENMREADRPHRTHAKEDTNKKRYPAKDKEEDRTRHKHTSDSSKHKRRRSSSTSGRGRNRKDNDSSDEASDASKRKLHSKKRHSSPSPVRSRRRQVSRSPHSKHSQRRHSPYSSLETSRGRR